MPRLLTDEESREAQLKKCGIACFGTTYESRDIAILEAQANLTRHETAREIFSEIEKWFEIEEYTVSISPEFMREEWEKFKSRYLEGK